MTIKHINFYKIEKTTEGNPFVDVSIKLLPINNKEHEMPEIVIPYLDDLFFDKLNAFDYKNILLDGLKRLKHENIEIHIGNPEDRIEDIVEYIDAVKKYIKSMDTMLLKPSILNKVLRSTRI